MDKENNTKKQQETSPSPSFRVWLCGPFRVERLVGCAGLAPVYEVVRSADWSGSTLPRLLLKLLLCLPRRQARREAIVDLLWPDADPEQATQYIHTATTKLRKVFQRPAGQESLLLTEDDATWYCLEGQDLIWTDVDTALAALSEAERIGYLLPEALPFLEQAVEYLGRGGLLEEEDGSWITNRRATIERARYRSRLRLSEAYIQQKQLGQAEAILSLLLEEDPTDEDVACRLMELFYQQGMTHQALRLYEQTSQLLGENGLAPTAALKDLAECFRSEKLRPILPLSDLSLKRSPALQEMSPDFSQGGTQGIMGVGQELQARENGNEPVNRREANIALGTLGLQLLSSSTWKQYTSPSSVSPFSSLPLQDGDLFVGDRSPDLSKATVANLATVTLQFRAMQRQGNVFITNGVNTHIQTLQDALAQTVNDGLRHELWRVLAQTQIVAGFNPLKNKKTAQGQAKTLLESAVASAQNGGDTLLTGAALGHLAHFSLRKEQNLVRVGQLLDQAQEYVPASHSLRGWFTLIMASIAAKTGNEQQCEAYLTDAMTIAHHLPLSPDYADLYFTDFDLVSAQIFAVHCWLTLGNAEKAYTHLTEINLEDLADNRRASAFCDASKVCAMMGEFETAQRLAFQAIDKASSTEQLYVISRCITLAQIIQQKAPDKPYAAAITDYARLIFQQH